MDEVFVCVHDYFCKQTSICTARHKKMLKKTKRTNVWFRKHMF